MFCWLLFPGDSRCFVGYCFSEIHDVLLVIVSRRFTMFFVGYYFPEIHDVLLVIIKPLYIYMYL